MKIKLFFKTMICALIAVTTVAACTKESIVEDEPVLNGPSIFVKVDNITDKTAEVTVVPYMVEEGVKYYGYATDDLKNIVSEEKNQIKKIVNDLLKEGHGMINGAHDGAYTEKIVDAYTTQSKETENKKNLTKKNLTEKKTYRYIAFAVTEDGEIRWDIPYKRIEFDTVKGTYKNIDGKFDASFSQYKIVQDKNGSFDCIMLNVSQKGEESKFFCPQLLDKNVYRNLKEQGVKEAEIAEIFGDQLSSIFTDMVKGNKTQMEDICLNKAGEYAQPRYSDMGAFYSGDYYAFIYGFNEDGTADKTYTKVELTVPKDENIHPSFEKWLGNWNFADEKGNSYRLNFSTFDNNLSYKISGWETGEQAENDINNLPFLKAGIDMIIEGRFDYSTGKVYFEHQTIGMISDHEIFGFAGFFPLNGRMTSSHGFNFQSNKVAGAKLKDDNTADVTGCKTKALLVDPTGAKKWQDIEFKYFRYSTVDTQTGKDLIYNAKAPILPATMTRISEPATVATISESSTMATISESATVAAISEPATETTALYGIEALYTAATSAKLSIASRAARTGLSAHTGLSARTRHSEGTGLSEGESLKAQLRHIMGSKIAIK